MGLVDIPGNGDIASFSMGIYPVTNGEFLKFLRQNPTQDQYLRGALESLQEKSKDPVTSITWYEAKAYCKWLGLRLPTSAEWELAAGVTPDNLLNYGWFHENSGSHVHQVGLKLPNPNGLYDMWGNVWEWTDEAVGSSRGLRGGSWIDHATVLRSAGRLNFDPAYRYSSVGFRCVSHQNRASNLLTSESYNPDLRWKQILEMANDPHGPNRLT